MNLPAQNDDVLRSLQGLYRENDVRDDLPQIPVLKINYDAESIYPAGEWVVGQKKDQVGTIVEQGALVKGLVIVLVRRRYSYYNEKVKDANCNSPIFHGTMPVFGSRYGFNCKSGECPKRGKELSPRCKCQQVVFGTAITADKKLVDCISYMGGATWIPLDEHLELVTKARMGSGYVRVPAFAYMTLLGSERKKNAGTVYYEGRFQVGPMLNTDQHQHFARKRAEVERLIEDLNSRAMTKKAAEGAATAAAAGAPPAGITGGPAPATGVTTVTDVMDAVFTETATPAQPIHSEPDIPDFPGMSEGFGGAVPQVPAPSNPTPAPAPTPDPAADIQASGGADYDIEAAIKEALGGIN